MHRSLRGTEKTASLVLETLTGRILIHSEHFQDLISRLVLKFFFAYPNKLLEGLGQIISKKIPSIKQINLIKKPQK